MSKIYQVILKMIENTDKISNAVEGDSDEVFFLYNAKYCWSVLRQSGSGKYAIYYYPENSPGELTNVIDWEDVKLVAYTEKEIPEEDAQRKLHQLYKILRDKVASEADVILDEILADD
ncbi:hypothetical protein Gbem_4134 [Citrifermentans bemidjiense Bem]|uniref:Uncharacterized protein n=1 Tax=Citrifermentans bemidjiense (strain ATCC BAA-1014 / DSM 16622 / JCM 12645 / Bem) TaxID=404380 RepID=E1P6D5_CITBB|nr:hypothetical protein [Citrifermentans bemidjiense]ADO00830.1 hypothetical protein Gbem_4134 [Citrifermentans bemidjiense Bem]